MGGRQWHGGVRPIFRGGMTALRHENLHGGTKAACSVAAVVDHGTTHGDQRLTEAAAIAV